MAWKLVISNSHLRVEYVYVKCNQQLTKYKSETQYNNTNYKIKPYLQKYCLKLWILLQVHVLSFYLVHPKAFEDQDKRRHYSFLKPFVNFKTYQQHPGPNVSLPVEA